MKSKKAFTLIELLVVILIIGILAAVALPQYQKVVEKSKAAQALTLIKSVGLAAEEYTLANDTVFTSFDDLSLDIPWTGNELWTTASHIRDTRSNAEWSLELYRQNNDSSGTLLMGRINGKYKGAGFMMILIPNHPHANTIYCVERVSMSGGAEFEEPAGSYCKQIMHGIQTPERVGNFTFDTYALP